MASPPLPGDGHVYGNFPSYYSFHSCESRMTVLPPNLFTTLFCSREEVYAICDVGCNSGDLTLQLYKTARQQLPSHVRIKVLGIDIDAALIERANGKVSSERGKKDGTSEEEGVEIEEGDEVVFAVKDIMSPSDQEYLKNYFSSSSLHLLCLFSITLWIHLNHGDDGIRALFSFSSSLLDNDSGCLLIEPQPWKAYNNAKKRASRLGLPIPKHFTSITLKKTTGSNSDFDHIATSDTSLGYKHVYRCGVGNFNTQQRPITLYLKASKIDLPITAIEEKEAFLEKEKKRKMKEEKVV